MALKITSNYRERALIAYCDLTPTEREDFSYVADEAVNNWDDTIAEIPRFVRAYGSVWDTHEFLRATEELSLVAFKSTDQDALVRWDAYSTQSAFHAIVLRWFDRDGYELEGPIVGWAQW